MSVAECPATMQAVIEGEFGEGDGCPLCGRPPELHRNEYDDADPSATEEWARGEAVQDWGGS